MISELEVLKIVAQKLESEEIPYMVTGSVAANFYTTPRMTRDIDVIIQVEKDDAPKLFKIFSDDFYVDRDALEEAVKKEGMFNVIHNEAIVKVDFIIRKNTKYRKIEFGRKRRIVFEGIEVYATAPEDLVLSKLFWAKESMSEMQIKDVQNILDSMSDIDIEYIKKWVEELTLEEIFKKIKV